MITDGIRKQLWHLFQPTRLFSAKDEHGRYSECHHLAQMVAILGDPPLDFLQASKKSSEYWDENGKFFTPNPFPCTLSAVV
jgi:serine/threonine-protein kinase SRPK3